MTAACEQEMLTLPEHLISHLVHVVFLFHVSVLSFGFLVLIVPFV